MVRSKLPRDAQTVDQVDAMASRRKRGRPSAAIRMALAAYALVQQEADELERTFTLTITFHPGNRTPTITIQEAPDRAPNAEETDVSPPSTK